MKKANLSKGSKILLFLVGISIILSIGIIISSFNSGNSSQQTQTYENEDNTAPF
jgi:nitrogen fixation-related uncharacterized protein